MGWTYTALMRALVPLVKRHLHQRARKEPLYAHAWQERFGVYAQAPQVMDVWLHAVSLGEARAARILIERLRARMPHWRWLLTQGTATGRAELAQLVREGDVQVWQPWDTPQAVASFLDHFKPRIGLIMETEVWPNWIHEANARGLPLVMVNARLSEQSLKKAQRLWFWSRPAYQGIRLALAQTQADADRLAQAGVERLKVLGNLKFDARIHTGQWQMGQDLRQRLGKPVVMLASSREGEEAQWAQAWLKARASWSPVHWLIVPRHPQRFEEVALALQAQGLTVVRRSSLPANANAWPALSTDTVLLGDSLGEMSFYYGLSDVALMGGSFEPLGGQNLIEACACGCPVLVGPHTFNFKQATELAVEAGAAMRVSDVQAALLRAKALVSEPDQIERLKRHALAFTKAHQGATEATVEEILSLLKP